MHRRKLLLAAASPLLFPAASFTGRWRSVETTKGGIGAVYVFRPNNTALYNSVALVESDYKLEAAQLTLSGQNIGVGFHPDGRMQFNFGGGVLEDYTRQGPQPDPVNRIVGEWKGNRIMENRSLPVVFQFRPDGRALMVIYLRMTEGRYALAAGKWRMNISGLAARTIEPTSDGRLTITVDGGDPHPFTRF